MTHSRRDGAGPLLPGSEDGPLLPSREEGTNRDPGMTGRPLTLHIELPENKQGNRLTEGHLLVLEDMMFRV